MSVTAARHPRTPGVLQLLADRRAAGTLPSTLHVLLDVQLADDPARVRATLEAFAAFGDATGIPVRLGTAGGPASLGRLDSQHLERLAAHLGAYARGVDGAAVQSRGIARTGPRYPRLARLFGVRPLAVFVTARPPADRFATTQALTHSGRAGLPWLVVTTSLDIDEASFRSAVRAAPGAVAVAEVTDLRERPDALYAAIVDAWDRHTGAEG